jgi:hypothetical protein
MLRNRVRFFARPLSALALALFCTLVPSGCGEDEKKGLVPVTDQQATEARNKAQEDYMKSKEGKAAQTPK